MSSYYVVTLFSHTSSYYVVTLFSHRPSYYVVTCLVIMLLHVQLLCCYMSSYYVVTLFSHTSSYYVVTLFSHMPSHYVVTCLVIMLLHCSFTCPVIMLFIIFLLSCPTSRPTLTVGLQQTSHVVWTETRSRPATPSLQYGAGPPGPVVPCPQIYCSKQFKSHDKLIPHFPNEAEKKVSKYVKGLFINQ